MRKPLTVNRNYDIVTTRGRVEAQVVQPNVAIFAADYTSMRWHERINNLQVGSKFDGGIVLSIKERPDG